MKIPLVSVSILCAAFLVGCKPATPSNTTATSSTSSVQSASLQAINETHNVSYQGIVQKAGMSVYMQGTHRLELSDGRVVLLESQELDLNRYVNKKVAVLGAVRPTVEDSGMIMRVEQITLLQEESSSSSSEVSSEEGSSHSSVESSASSVAASSKSSVMTVSSKSSVSSIAISSIVSSASSSMVSSMASSSFSSLAPLSTTDTEAQMNARVQIMAKANMADALWTQQYCTTHIGFCFPVHKNWWFKSFGTTTSYLWHIEISTEDITDLGQGPLVVNVMSGNLASVNAVDGTVRTQGEFVIGYKALKDNSHIEVSAPKALEAAVRYILGHIQVQ